MKNKRLFTHILVLAITLVATFFTTTSARALTCNVPSASYATIQDAIDDPACDPIVIAAGVHTENLVIDHDVTIQGSGQGITRILGGLAGRVINIPLNVGQSIVVTISDLSIEEGDVVGQSGLDAYGGGIFNAETLTLDNVRFINNFAEYGGALATYSDAITIIQNSEFTHNIATSSTENIYNNAPLGTLTITNSTVSGSGNTNPIGTGITTTGPTEIRDSVVQNHSGDGIYAYSVMNSGIDFVLERSIVRNNAGHGVWLSGTNAAPSNLATITGSTIENNYRSGIIAAGNNVQLIVNEYIDTNGVVTRSLVEGNGNSGIVHNGTGALEIRQSDILNNVADVFCGGGVSVVSGATATIRATSIEGNNAYSGGGVCLANSSSADVRRSAIVKNVATGSGGGIDVLGSSTLSLVNSTVAENSADRDGGGINLSSGIADLTNVTIARNYADFDGNGNGAGGGYYVSSPTTMMMVNTLVSANKLGSGSKSDCSGAVVSGGTNLVRVGNVAGCSGFIASDMIGTNLNPFDANVAALKNNGGPTATIALKPISPAIDAGNTSVCAASPVNEKDQRGYSRAGVGAACDIGAYERNATP